jgi:serine/threonine protein kinase
MNDSVQRIGPYTVESEIGRGGMGVVYLARDARLGRAVALKSLPENFAVDPERVARFEREARLLASIQHTNIATIHGIEQDGGRSYLVLEYVAGETLSERLERGPLPVRDGLEVCRQIAAALEAAHDRGVIHRDLKPGNVRLAPNGEAKVLDFGLAKGTDSSDSEPDLSKSPALASTRTALGMILGTAAYMSPEQARGRALDRRTDIWSFGCVLYECLTGRQAFPGETVSDCIAGILEHEPDWNALPAKTPARVVELLHRCLEKDAKRRLRDAGDARLELEVALATWNSGTVSLASRPDVRSDSGLVRWVLGIPAGLILGAGIMALVHRPVAPHDAAAVTRLSVRLPPGQQLAVENLSLTGAWDLSPDGRTLALLFDAQDFGSSPRVYLRRLDQFETRPVPGTELATSRPIFSADGHDVFVQSRLSKSSPDAVVLRIPVDREAPAVTVTNVQADWVSFGVMPGGDLLFTTADGHHFVRVPGTGGTPSPGRSIDAGAYDGTFSLTRAGRPLDDRHVFLRTIHYGADGWHWGIACFDPETGKATQLLADGGYPTLLPSGHLLYSVGDAIHAVRFDRERMQLRGEPTAVLAGLRSRGRYVPGMFTLSSAGTLVYVSGGRVAERRTLALVDLNGRATRLAGDPAALGGGLTVSQSSTRLAYTVTNPHGIDEIWVRDLPGTTGRRLVSFPDADCSWVALSADGRSLAFRLNGPASRNGVYVQRLDGGEPQRVFEVSDPTGTAYGPTSWSPDGTEILVRILTSSDAGFAVLRLGANGQEAQLRPLLPSVTVQNGPRFSPDGRWITFTSAQSGHQQMYVVSYDRGVGAGDPTAVGPPGAFFSRFTLDSRSLVFRDSTWIASVPRPGEGTASGTRRLYGMSSMVDQIGNFEILADGRTLVALLDPEERRIDHIEVVENWARELQPVLDKLR